MNASRWMILALLFFGLVVLFKPAAGGNQPYTQNSASPSKKIDSYVNITPSCLDRSNIPPEELHWLYMPSNARELSTSEYYGFLAGELIKAGVVNASDCPLGGLWPTGYANSCGLERSRQAVLYLQNVYDDEILAVGRDVGVPPPMLKQLIRYESQFWPVRMGLYHYGLGHMTFMGASNALMWSPELYESVCRGVYNGPCPEPYSQASSKMNATLAGHLLGLMDTTCPTCDYKIDIPKAERSVGYLGQVLIAYCKQTAQVVFNVTKKHSSFTVDYPTIWKLTLLNYNAGPVCVYDAIKASYTSEDAVLNWGIISGNVKSRACEIGVLYVNNITSRYYNFPPSSP